MCVCVCVCVCSVDSTYNMYSVPAVCTQESPLASPSLPWYSFSLKNWYGHGFSSRTEGVSSANSNNNRREKEHAVADQLCRLRKKAVLTQTLEVHKLRSSSILMAPNFFHAYALEAAFQICLKTNKVRGLQFQNELVLRADHHAIPNQMPYSGQTNSLI